MDIERWEALGFHDVGPLFGSNEPGSKGFMRQVEDDVFDYAFSWTHVDQSWSVLTGRIDLGQLPEDLLDSISKTARLRVDMEIIEGSGLGDTRADLAKAALHMEVQNRYEVPETCLDSARADAALESYLDEAAYSANHVRALVIPVGGEPYTVLLEKDGEGSCLDDLQDLVGGCIDIFGAPVVEGVDLYVNDEGIYGCMPNRAIFATPQMELDGYLSQLNMTEVSREDELYAVLFGNIVCVGCDEETGECRDLTEDEECRAWSYFTEVSRPLSGIAAVQAIKGGERPLDRDTVDEMLHQMKASHPRMHI